MLKIRCPDFKSYGFTCSLIAINVSAYIALAALGNNFLVIDDEKIALLGQWNGMVLKKAAYWQLLTAMFVHFNLIHLSVNMIFLAESGMKFERHLGGSKLIIIYLVAGLVGNLLTLCLGPETLSAGSSGAVLGIYSALLVINERVLERPMGSSLVQLAVLFLLNSVLPGVNVMSHLGGVAIGALIGHVEAKRYGTSS